MVSVGSYIEASDIYSGDVENTDDDEIIVRDNNALKLADTVVRDDNGAIIPFSRRFLSSPDIR